MDSEFEGLLKSLEASDDLMRLVEVVTKKEWAKKVKTWDEGGRFYENKSKQLIKEIEEAAKRLLKTGSEAVIAEIEKQIERMKAEQQEMEIEASKYRQLPPNYDDAFDVVSTMLKSPYSYWKSGSAEQKRTVHRLVFTVPPCYDITTGVYTVDYSLPYQITSMARTESSCLVEVAGVTPASKTMRCVILHAQV